MATPYGTVVSEGDFFSPPPSYNEAAIEVTDRMSIGQNKAVTITQPNKNAMILFDGMQGQGVILRMDNLTATFSHVKVYDPKGTLVRTQYSVSSNNTIFDGWSGDADCNDGNVTMGASKTCTASFSLMSGEASYTYDELGRLTVVTSQNATIIYAYDSVGNLQSVTRQ